MNIDEYVDIKIKVRIAELKQDYIKFSIAYSMHRYFKNCGYYKHTNAFTNNEVGEYLLSKICQTKFLLSLYLGENKNELNRQWNIWEAVAIGMFDYKISCIVSEEEFISYVKKARDE